MLKPKVKGISALKYPEGAYHKMIDMADKVKDLVAAHDPDIILIEEVNRGINRIGQKSLDALHFFVLDRLALIDKALLKKVRYMDSNGRKGWRPTLNIKLDEQDKAYNKLAREFNVKNKKAIKAGEKSEKEIIGWKHLSVRYVNKRLKMELDVNKDGDPDIADAICLGFAHLKI